jgi:hypothetical protein
MANQYPGPANTAASQSVGNQISLGAAKRVVTALAKQEDGNEILSAINNMAWGCPAMIIAAHVSSTTDFSALKIGDIVIHIPATAGNSSFSQIVTTGTLPVAAVVGDLYVVKRQMSQAVQANVTL